MSMTWRAHEVRRGLHKDRRSMLVEGDLGLGVLQVEALCDLTVGLLNRVVDLLHVDFADDVETLVLCHVRVDLLSARRSVPATDGRRAVAA
jgi:hypothetical protein